MSADCFFQWLKIQLEFNSFFALFWWKKKLVRIVRGWWQKPLGLFSLSLVEKFRKKFAVLCKKKEKVKEKSHLYLCFYSNDNFILPPAAIVKVLWHIGIYFYQTKTEFLLTCSQHLCKWTTNMMSSCLESFFRCVIFQDLVCMPMLTCAIILILKERSRTILADPTPSSARAH